jgi:hypothetical protein
MNNKGVTYILIMVMMSVIFIFALAISTMGLNDAKMSVEDNDRSKSYYMAEAGVYYAKGVIHHNPDPMQVPSTITVPADAVDIGPFYDSVTPDNGYAKQHGFILTIIYSGSSTYTVKSRGQYNGRESMLQASIPADGSIINNLQEITDKTLQ